MDPNESGPATATNRGEAKKNEAQEHNTTTPTSLSSIGSERVVLAAMMLRPNFKPALEHTAFASHQHGLIFAAITRLRGSGRTADLVSVTEALLGEKMDVHPGYLAALVDEPLIDPGSHVDRLRALERQRQLLHLGEALRAAATEGDQEAIERLTQLIGKSPTKAAGKISLAALPLTDAEMRTARTTPTTIVENYLYADVGVMAAPGGTGKTTLQINEGVCIVLGRPVHGLKVVKPGKVLLVTAEDRREQVAARLREIMAEMELSKAERERVLAGFLIWDVTGENLKLIRQSDGNIIPTDLADEIVTAFRDDPPVLVVFDPVVSFGVSEGMVNDNEQGIITACRRIVRGLDCCVRVIAHTGKANAREGTLDQYSSRGGSALADGSRMFAVLKNWTPEDTTHTPPHGCTWTPETSITIMARPKLSYAPPQPHIWIRRTGWKYEAFLEVRRTREEKQAETYDKVLRALEAELKAGAKHTKTSLEGAVSNVPRGELRKAINRLMALGRIVEVDLPPEEQRTRRKTYLLLGSFAASFGSIPKNPTEDEAEEYPGNNAAAYRESNGGIIPPPIIPQFSNDASVDRQDSAGLAGLDQEDVEIDL